jgi:hypothetical protein
MAGSFCCWNGAVCWQVFDVSMIKEYTFTCLYMRLSLGFPVSQYIYCNSDLYKYLEIWPQSVTSYCIQKPFR